MAKIYMATKDDVTTLGSHIGPIVQSELDEVYAAVAAKGGTVPTEKTLGNLKAAVESIEDRFNDWIEDSGEMVSLSSSARTIRPYAFYETKNLSSVNLPDCIFIGTSSFANCTKIRSVHMNNVQDAGLSAFSHCSLLEDVQADRLAKLRERVFANTAIRTITLPSCTIVAGGQGPFQHSPIETINLPVVSECIGLCVFCYKLKTVDHRPLNSSVVRAFEYLGQSGNYFPAKNTVRINCADGYLTFNGTEWVLNAYE